MTFSTGNDPLTDAAASYAAQVRREAELNGIALTLSASPGWDEIFSAEAAVIKKLPLPDLRRRAWIVYDRYAEVAGAEKAARRAAASSLNVDTCDESILRADLLQVHNETARIYTIGFQVERQRAELTRFVLRVATFALAAFIAFLTWVYVLNQNARTGWRDALGGWIVAVLVLLIGAGSVFVRRRKSAASIVALFVLLMAAPNAFAQTAGVSAAAAPPRIPLVPLVMLAGILGATFSILQRVQRNTSTDPLLALLAFRAARPQIFLSIASGAIGSLVLYAIFAGGMIQGDLFPRIVNSFTKTDGSAMMAPFHFLTETGPLGHADYGKMLVWAFVAGFAERLVPDILDRFTASAKK